MFNHFGVQIFIPDIEERVEEDAMLEYVVLLGGAIDGDDFYTLCAIEACAIRLMEISKWEVGIDCLDKTFCDHFGAGT